jgi:hypothetical protein
MMLRMAGPPRFPSNSQSPGLFAAKWSLSMCARVFILAAGFLALGSQPTWAQASYVARFKMEKSSYILGEPIFCDFTLHNAGTQTLLFSYRFPSRAANRDLPQEPRFSIREAGSRAPADPAPHPCGGARGSVVYGTVTLPPGRTHTERWLLNQWARFARPGKYRVHAERRLPLKTVNSTTNAVSTQPIAYALALDNLTFEIAPSTPAQRRATLEPYAKLLMAPDSRGFAEAFLVATTLPQSFFMDRLAQLAAAPEKEHRWERDAALEGLARLGTRPAWDDILAIARNGKLDDALRAYAILLLGERADPKSVPAMLQLLAAAPASLRDDILRALGFFRDPRANQVLFDQLHSPRASDRVNAILGVRNLESKNAVPALLAMLDDPDDQVRQVANFALQGLTGRKFKAPDTSSSKEATGLAKRWHDWWLKHEATFQPIRQPACHDW